MCPFSSHSPPLQAEFEQTLSGGEQAVVEMNFSGYGVHCGEGWIATDLRLLENVTQIQNATVTFFSEGKEGNAIKFEPNERLSFHVFLKPTALKTCSGNLSFVFLFFRCDYASL